MTKISVGIVAAALSLAAPYWVHAAGLGRLNVLSPLGHPLNAEIEIVSLLPGEEESLTARAASIEAFRQAGIEPHPALVDMRFAIVRRNGRPVIHVTTSQPVNEPFLDLLVELQWDQGRLVREYTMLLDPPEYRGPQTIAATPAQPAALEARPLARVDTAPPPPQPAQVQPAASPVPAAAATPAPAPSPLSPSAEHRYTVNRGDTLGAIARQHVPQGATLNQMLIALFRSNQDAFIRGNINLVRAGRVLDIPSEEGVRAIDMEEANRLVQAHRGEFEDYRRRLAAAPALADPARSQQAVAGTIEPKATAPAPATQQDQVRLAQADPAHPGAMESNAAARGDDAVARERALQEANSRIADLEKTVADLQKLLAIQNQQLSQMQSAASPPAASAPVPAQPAQGETPQPQQATAQAESGQAETEPALAPQAKKPAAAKPKPAAKAKTAPPPPPPSVLDEVLENPLALGVGGVALLVFGYGVWAWRRKKTGQATIAEEPAMALAEGGFDASADAAPSSAAAVATEAKVPGMDADEVDPIAEADVYMAYGRDAQAEEILKEALNKNADHLAAHAKLLEIYAKRRDVQAFEQTALKIKGLTHGTGPEWQRAAALGHGIDPGNDLYGGTVAAVATAAVPAVAAPALDFDLSGATNPGSGVPDIRLDEPAGETGGGVDLDVGSPSVNLQTPLMTDEPKAATSPGTITSFDFDLNLGDEAPKPPRSGEPEVATEGGLDFELNIDLADDPATPPGKAAAPLDLSTITLDLGSAGEPSATSSNDPKWQEVATKLDLAKAYEEMGDKDGARELLSEVMKDGDTEQKGQAELLLAKL